MVFRTFLHSQGTRDSAWGSVALRTPGGIECANAPESAAAGETVMGAYWLQPAEHVSSSTESSGFMVLDFNVRPRSGRAHKSRAHFVSSMPLRLLRYSPYRQAAYI